MEDLGIENLLTGYELENLFNDSNPANEPPEPPKGEPGDNGNKETTEETTEVNPEELFGGSPESVGSE